MVSKPCGPCAECKARLAEAKAKVEARDRELSTQAKAGVALGRKVADLEARIEGALRLVEEARGEAGKLEARLDESRRMHNETVNKSDSLRREWARQLDRRHEPECSKAGERAVDACPECNLGVYTATTGDPEPLGHAELLMLIGTAAELLDVGPGPTESVYAWRTRVGEWLAHPVVAALLAKRSPPNPKPCAHPWIFVGPDGVCKACGANVRPPRPCPHTTVVDTSPPTCAACKAVVG